MLACQPTPYRACALSVDSARVCGCDTKQSVQRTCGALSWGLEGSEGKAQITSLHAKLCLPWPAYRATNSYCHIQHRFNLDAAGISVCLCTRVFACMYECVCVCLCLFVVSS